MQVTLCLDFGNTRLKYAIFHNDILMVTDGLFNEQLETIQSLYSQYRPSHCILSSVIHHNPAIEIYLNKTTRFHKLNNNSKLSFRIPVGKPETIGADRLALCAAVTYLKPHHHHLIIALGSCITFNFINVFNEFLGGSISPGLRMRFKSMNDYTAALPLIEVETGFPLIGYDTKTNLLSGVILGIAKEMDGIIGAYCEKYDKPRP